MTAYVFVICLLAMEVMLVGSDTATTTSTNTKAPSTTSTTTKAPSTTTTTTTSTTKAPSTTGSSATITTTRRPLCKIKCPGRGTRFYPAEDQSHYYVCSNGVLYRMKCSKNEYYNPSTMKCERRPSADWYSCYDMFWEGSGSGNSS